MLRAVHKAKIPLWYTEGYNPHAFVTFALPLSLGFRGNRESMDMKIDETKITERSKAPDGSEKFSIFMNLGSGNGKRFRTVWQKDTPDSKPRLITAHRER